ncbi:MAG: hypothetical protein ACLQSR_09360 [Limisphaerales bacterium]
MLDQTIKLGLDVHADTIVVVRILDHNTPQPAQKFTPAKFLAWVRTQAKLADTVHSCYEADHFGSGLHRELIQLGVRNVVVQPVCLDERLTGVNHDTSDAKELAQRLDRYASGNHDALATVRVPTPQDCHLQNLPAVRTVHGELRPPRMDAHRGHEPQVFPSPTMVASLSPQRGENSPMIRALPPRTCRILPGFQATTGIRLPLVRRSLGEGGFNRRPHRKMPGGESARRRPMISRRPGSGSTSPAATRCRAYRGSERG